MPRFKIGDILRLEFTDHAEDMDRTVIVEAFGRVFRFDDDTIVIDGWRLPHEIDVGNGLKRWAIIRSTIVKIDKLVKA